jgi:hypothetical protein
MIYGPFENVPGLAQENGTSILADDRPGCVNGDALARFGFQCRPSDRDACGFVRDWDGMKCSSDALPLDRGPSLRRSLL